MNNDELDKIEKRETWEVTWLFVGLLLVIILSLIGWYMEGSGTFPR